MHPNWRESRGWCVIVWEMHAYHLRPRQTNHCSCLGYLAWLDAQDVPTTFFSLKEIQAMRNATTAREKSAYNWFMENFTAWQEKFSVGNHSILRRSGTVLSRSAMKHVLSYCLKLWGKVACPASAPCQQTQIDSQDATDAWQVHMQESGASRIWWMVKRMCCPIQCVLSEAGKVAEQELFTILQAT